MTPTHGDDARWVRGIVSKSAGEPLVCSKVGGIFLTPYLDQTSIVGIGIVPSPLVEVVAHGNSCRIQAWSSVA
jgi:hypothetical protein